MILGTYLMLKLISLIGYVKHSDENLLGKVNVEYYYNNKSLL